MKKNYPLSQTQMGIYVTCMNTHEEGNYNVDMLYKLDDDVDIERLASALDKVIDVHPYVKSRLVMDDNGDVMFEDHCADEFHTSIFEIDNIEDIRKHLGEDYDLMNDQLFRLEIYKTREGNYFYADFHHIVFDGMSLTVFRKNVEDAYNGLALEQESVNGFAIALKEQEERKSAEFETMKEWYAKEFGAASEVDSMPLPDIYGDDEEHFAKRDFLVDVDKEKLQALCDKVGVKESVVFTAAFGLLLSKYACEDEVLYSTAFHGRNDKATRQSFCMMVKTLPVYHNITETPTIESFLQRTHQQMSSTRKNSLYSFADMHNDLGISSNIGFVYQGTVREEAIYLEGRRQHSQSLITHTPGFKFLAMLMVVEQGYSIWCEYQSNKYSAEFIAEFWKSYQHIINEMCEKETLAEIEICDEQQLSRIKGFNHPVSLEEESIIEAFKKAAKLYPDNVAAKFKDKKYTYRELDELTDKVAALIYNKVKYCGKTEPVVSILIPRNENMFILPLAAMKAGCAYQPLDPSYPQERLNFMVKDADAALLIADDELMDIINEYEGETVPTSELTETNLQSITSQSLPLGEVVGTSLMILLYTSGSTGIPKGVMLEHRQVMAYIRWYQQNYEMTPESVSAAYASFGFDADMMDLYAPLTLGATLCIIPEEIRLDLIALRDFMNDNGVTVAFMTTQVAQQFALNVDGCKTLKHLSMGGEKMMSINPHPEFKLHNIYGPTECSVAVTHYEVDKYEHNIPIGHPTASTTLKIVDKNWHRLPAGAAGELWINGPQVGRGYLNRPEKTAEVFVEHEGKRWYRTGDIVRYRQDGNIEFVGRKDGQVKIRGFRIELKEVEAVIRDFEGIKDVTVQAFDDPNGGKYIAAYVVSDNEVNIDALNAFILDQKPPYMVPAVTMQIEKIPLNVNQKVDKKALPKPELKMVNGTSENGKSIDAPLNALEIEIKSIISSVINAEDFSITDILGYVGLTSISSIKLATLIYKKFDVQINAKTLAKTGTIQSIENEILMSWMNRDANAANQSEETNEKQSTDHQSDAVPMTFAQTGVYFDIVRNPGSVSYNMPFIYTFPEGVKAEQLQQTVKAVLSTHKILGSHFAIKGTDVVLAYSENFVPEVEMVSANNEKEYNALKADFVKPFNVSSGPLYRVKIVTCCNKVRLFMDTLHLVMDGASVSLLIKQLTDALEGKTPKMEQYTYFDYARDEQLLIKTPEYAASEEFFTEKLKTVDGVSNITEDIKSEEGVEARLCFAERNVDSNKVAEVAKTLGVTPANMFLAAAFYTVSRYTNTPDVCLCTISNGRSNLRISDTLGMFVNTIAIPSHITDISVKEFIRNTAEDFSAAIDHENYPFAKIAEKFDIAPTLFFQYQVGVLDEIKVKLAGHDSYDVIEKEDFGESTPKFKFTISIEPASNNGVKIQIQYDDTLYTEELAQGFADAMGAVLDNFMADTSASLKHVSMLTADQAKLISAFHETKKADVPVQLYHKLFEKSVAEHLDDLALVALNPYTGIYDSFTFAKLNEHMNHIANSLIQRGVKAGDRIALLLPRTSRLIMSQYGVLKAGGAYIPCDPKYPTERINLILEDSESKYIITTQDRLAEFPDRAIDVEELLFANSETSTSNPNVDVQPDDLAYLIYTSGSTGRPKGVQLMHKGVCNYHHEQNIIQSCLKNECHAALGITTVSFDMSVWETGSPLMHGKTLVFVGDDDCNDPNRLAWLVDTYRIDCMTATTSRFMQLLESPVFEEAFARHIHLAYQGGEGLSMALLRKLQSYPNVRIFNGYGPTETIANSHASELTKDNLPHIGKPCVNYSNFIVDNDGNELPVGVVGELIIGGNSVAKGYNNLPEQTASRFVEYQGERVYKSGDYARWLPDGNVMVLGRKDNQVKLRGLRIELGEVETAITKVEGVKNVAVMIKKLQGKDHLCAYFTADRAIAIDDMKAEISRTLTHYMVPTAYLQMDAFPLTPNGKTDVRHLPEPQLAAVGGDYVAPKNKTEEDFCGIFAKILDLDKVSAADSFFELGGSSLTATRVVIEATNLGYTISYSEVFDNPTAQKMANFVNNDEDESEIIDHEIADYDYSKINAILEANSFENFRNGERLALGDVLLTGANGYLGIHILKDLLENHLKEHLENKVYCLVRHGKNGISSETRLRNLLFYYFEKNYKDMFGNQLIVIDGDVTDPKAFDEVAQIVNGTWTNGTCINCAALVKHFSDGTEIEDINIGGLQNCVDFCLKTGARLIQTSTNSTAGESINNYPDVNTLYTEQMHYIGQNLSSKYTHSKFIAERIVLEAIIEKGLIAKIVRLGNLSPRVTDGEFQINFRSNSSMGRLHIFQMLGAISYSTAAMNMEFSPIDEVAHAVILLSTTPKECVIFHPVNNHRIILGDVVREMANVLNTNITEVEENDFQVLIQEAGQDPEKAKILQSMLAYANGKSQRTYLQADNSYTNSILARYGFHWNVTSWDYVARFIKAIAALDFFEDHR